jgi:hypothetical protein
MLLFISALIAYALAEICGAVMDTVNFHFDDMIFPRNDYWRVDYWYKEKPVYERFILNDAWHDFKKLRDFFVLASFGLFFYSGVSLWFYLPALPFIKLLFHEVFLHKIFRG